MLLFHLVILICVEFGVSGFAFTTNQQPSHNRKHKTRPSITFFDIHSAVNAVVYYPDGDDGPSLDDDVDYLPNLDSPDLQTRHQDLADKLSSKHQAALGHLASAFSPAGHDIRLEQINSVRCSSVDNKHIEIEAILCDDLECNSLLVPVDFPKECLMGDDGGSDSLTVEDCVIENIDVLEREGETALSQHNAAEKLEHVHYETLQSAEALLRDAPLEFPDWWVPPNNKEDSACELLIELLNEEDMLDERIDLARRACNLLPNDDIKTVKVQVVGPIGLLLKVKVGSRREGDQGIITKEVSIKFPEGTCSIREKMLELLSSVDVQKALDLQPVLDGKKELDLQSSSVLDVKKDLDLQMPNQRALLAAKLQNDQAAKAHAKMAKSIQDEKLHRSLLAAKLKNDKSSKETRIAAQAEQARLAKEREEKRIAEEKAKAAAVEEAALQQKALDFGCDDIETYKARTAHWDKDEDAKLAAKYSAIPDLGERLFTMLVDLNMVELHLDPNDSIVVTEDYDDELAW
jgi:hypothetical protein